MSAKAEAKAAAALRELGATLKASAGFIFTRRHRGRGPLGAGGGGDPGEPGHTRDTQAHTRTHGSHRRTSQPSKPNDTYLHDPE